MPVLRSERARLYKFPNGLSIAIIQTMPRGYSWAVVWRDEQREGLGDTEGDAYRHALDAAMELQEDKRQPAKPWEGGWYTDENGELRFRMPPYPGVDY